MENSSTFLSENTLNQVIQASADEIRSFLGFVSHPENDSPYSSVTKKETLLQQLSDSMRESARQFAQNPGKFSNDELLKMGLGLESAIKNYVRIEIRGSDGVEGAAQVVAKGIEGDFRLKALRIFRDRCGFSEKDLAVKFAGLSSIEFNMSGVNKALPFKYLNHCFHDVLDLMNYSPGSYIDARRARTAVAADGDGTIYGGPNITALPMLKESPVRAPLNEFLELGGVFILISGNNLQRSALRISGGIEKSLLSRCVVVGNGAASMAVFDSAGKLKEVEDYRQSALNYLKGANNNSRLDVIYIGDDGHPQGNDIDAFREVGLRHSFLVKKEKTGIDESLKNRFIPGELDAVAKLFSIIVETAKEKNEVPVFDEQTTKEILEKARG